MHRIAVLFIGYNMSCNLLMGIGPSVVDVLSQVITRIMSAGDDKLRHDFKLQPMMMTLSVLPPSLPQALG